MNLVGDPWIPLIFQDGRGELVSLREVFAQGEAIRDLVVTPPQRVAVMRLLVCVAQAALDGPADEADWRECRGRLTAAATSYLEKHQGDFELYADGDEGAFLQVPKLEPTDNAVVDKLDFGLAAGANATIFDHEATSEGREQSPAWQALMLLTFQCFSPGGTIGVARWNGRFTTADGSKPKGPGSSAHAPCLDGSPLHTIIRRRDLLSTIHSNLLTREMVTRLPNLQWGRPVWEEMPASAVDPRAEELASSYLGRLVPITRAARLRPGARRLTLVNGVTYPKFPEIREPSITVVPGKNDQHPLPLDLSKHPWRELASVLTMTDSLMEGRALVLRHLRPVDHDDPTDLLSDLWTGGLAADKGKVLDVAEWTFPFWLSQLDSTALAVYQRGVDLANDARYALGQAVGTYCDDLKLSDTKTNQKKCNAAAVLFWGRLDDRHEALIQAASDLEQASYDRWFREVFGAMHEAFRRSCPHQTPRQIRAFARGELRLQLARPEE